MCSGTHAAHVVHSCTILNPPSAPTNGHVVNRLFSSPDATMKMSGTKFTRTSSANRTPSTLLQAPTMVKLLSRQIDLLYKTNKFVNRYVHTLHVEEKLLFLDTKYT